MDDFAYKIQVQMENKQQKAKILEETKTLMELKDCTFQPQIYSQK